MKNESVEYGVKVTTFGAFGEIDKKREAVNTLSNEVKEAIRFFLHPTNLSKRQDFGWGTIYKVGPIVRIDIKKVP